MRELYELLDYANWSHETVYGPHDYEGTRFEFLGDDDPRLLVESVAAVCDELFGHLKRALPYLQHLAQTDEAAAQLAAEIEDVLLRE